MPKYLFVLSPPYSGSTVLWRLLATSPNVSSFEQEGQFLDSVKDVMADPWDIEKQFPWELIKSQWDNQWDQNKPVLLEKSPPNLVRAFEIERAFNPAYFVVINRDPYAFCEGMSRRRGNPVDYAARFWIRCAELQIKNLQGLQHVIHFTYEDFTQNPTRFSQLLLDFLPELGHIESEGSFRAQTIVGYDSRPITNMNQLKIDSLSPKQLESINKFLQERPDLMEFWGYQYVQPSKEHTLRYYRTSLVVKLKRLQGRVSRLLQRAILRTP